jgi:uncharacterized protein YdaU (DUF1376 family)
MKQSAPWFKLWVSDFLASNAVDLMTAEQIGWYFILLIRSWNNTPRAYLPNDKQMLALWCKCADQMSFTQRAEIVLSQFETTPDGQFIYHPKMVAQAEKLTKTSENRAVAGKSGGLKSGEQRRSKKEANASRLVTDSEPESEVRSKPSPTPPLRTEYEFTPSAAAMFIKNELGLGGQKFIDILRDVIEAEGKRYPIDPKDVAETMVTTWRLYQKSPRGQSRFAYKPSTFFSEGIWKQNPQLWEHTDGPNKHSAEHLAELQARGRENILKGMGIDIRDLDGQGVRPDSQAATDTGTGPVMEGVVGRISS